MCSVNSKHQVHSFEKAADGATATAAAITPVAATAPIATSDDGLEAAFDEALAQCEDVEYVRCGQDTLGVPNEGTRVEATSTVLKGRK